MQILYIDASGDPGPFMGKNTKYYVLAGISLSYKDWKLITDDFRSIVSKYFKTQPLPEVHTKELMTGKEPFDMIDHKQLVEELTFFLSQAHITLFGVVIDKVAFQKKKYGPPNTLVNRSLEEIVNRFHLYLQRHKTLGMIVSDASTNGFDTSVRNTYEYFRQQGTTYVTLNRIIDTIFFTPSETAIGIQMADFVSYSLKRNYENGDSKVFNEIERKFDHIMGRTHGLKIIK